RLDDERLVAPELYLRYVVASYLAGDSSAGSLEAHLQTGELHGRRSERGVPGRVAANTQRLVERVERAVRLTVDVGELQAPDVERERPRAVVALGPEHGLGRGVVAEPQRLHPAEQGAAVGGSVGVELDHAAEAVPALGRQAEHTARQVGLAAQREDGSGAAGVHDHHLVAGAPGAARRPRDGL